MVIGMVRYLIFAILLIIAPDASAFGTLNECIQDAIIQAVEQYIAEGEDYYYRGEPPLVKSDPLFIIGDGLPRNFTYEAGVIVSKPFFLSELIGASNTEFPDILKYMKGGNWITGVQANTMLFKDIIAINIKIYRQLINSIPDEYALYDPVFDFDGVDYERSFFFKFNVKSNEWERIAHDEADLFLLKEHINVTYDIWGKSNVLVQTMISDINNFIDNNFSRFPLPVNTIEHSRVIISWDAGLVMPSYYELDVDSESLIKYPLIAVKNFSRNDFFMHWLFENELDRDFYILVTTYDIDGDLLTNTIQLINIISDRDGIWRYKQVQQSNTSYRLNANNYKWDILAGW